MQYVRSISGSVSKTWNSINPATLSGAIDVIVVEHEDGTLSCSPFHVRFGKFSLLRPSDKKVEFNVNGVRQDYAMKLGEGGEAFFVFETTADVPEALQTSPLVSPASSPEAQPSPPPAETPMPDFEPLDFESQDQRPHSVGNDQPLSSNSAPGSPTIPSNPFAPLHAFSKSQDYSDIPRSTPMPNREQSAPVEGSSIHRSASPPILPKKEAVDRAMNLSKKLWSSNIPSQVNDEGDLMLDMTGYKSSEEEVLRAELVARKILSEELEGNYDIGSLIGADEKGNLWIYSSEEAKDTAARKATPFVGLSNPAMISSDALSDPGYHSDDGQSHKSTELEIPPAVLGSDSALGLNSPPDSPPATSAQEVDPVRSYAKTLRLTSDQLKALNLKPGPNPMSFSVNRATCQAFMYLWKTDVPIVISDIDGTITKSDALGHVLNMIGRDWTHQGVAKLFSEITANGYHILYLTSRSVGQADTTRAYLNGVIQEGYKLPKGPVIMSPDRTMAALRREIYLRKPEVFKMACLRDIMSLFYERRSPFYAGFGNRLTDALSYRSVNIPSTRIFTINSNAEVSLDLLSLNKYKTGYASMRETVDHFFPPVGMLLHEGGEEYTDFNYWRETPLDIDDLSASESEEEDEPLSEDEGDGDEDDDEDDEDDILSDELNESFISRDSVEDAMFESVEDVRQSIESLVANERADLMQLSSEDRAALEEASRGGSAAVFVEERDPDTGRTKSSERIVVAPQSRRRGTG